MILFYLSLFYKITREINLLPQRKLVPEENFADNITNDSKISSLT